jgi:hypothetical protein
MSAVGEKISAAKTVPIAKGTKFGRLSFLHRVAPATHALFRCDCGVEKIVLVANARRGKSRSCGCLARETASANNGTHRMSGTPEHKAWKLLRERCHRVKSPKAHRYSQRGIRVCERWDSFENFYTDMGPRPSLRHSADRINNDGDYEPGNCRWATPQQQGWNTSVNVLHTYKGHTACVAEFSNLYGMRYETLRRRLRRGWDITRAIEAPMTRGYQCRTVG